MSMRTRTRRQARARARQDGTAEEPPVEASTEWFTTEDLAAPGQLSPGTLSNWRPLTKGPEFVRPGGIVRYHRDAVTVWLAKQPGSNLTSDKCRQNRR